MEINISQYPAEVRLEVPDPGSKSTTSAKIPVVKTLFDRSKAIDNPASSSYPPIPFDHENEPEASNFQTNISALPTEVSL